MNTEKENQHGDSWNDSQPLWYLSFDFSGILDKIRRYLRKRKLRKRILARLQDARRIKE